MRVLIFTQYFSPEIGATQTRLETIARGLAERGHEVEVICEVPNHPQGVIHQRFRGRPIIHHRSDGFKTTYVWVHTKPEKSSRDRLLFYGSYMVMATALGSLRRRPDVVFASSPPLTVGVAGALVAMRHRVPFVLDVRDLWPEAAVAVGELTNPKQIRQAERIERWLYRRASAIATVTEPFREQIGERGGERIELIANGTTQLWVSAARLEPDRSELGLPPDRFIWTFAGNLGLAQGLDTAVAAADLLGDRFTLLLLGDGAARKQLERQAATLGEGSIIFHDQVSPKEAVKYVRASDALLVSLAPTPTLKTFVPSKLFDFCAAGRPVIVAAAGESQRLTDAAGAALAVEPGNARQLAATVERLYEDAELRAQLAKAGHQFGRDNLRERQLDRLNDLLADSGLVKGTAR